MPNMHRSPGTPASRQTHLLNVLPHHTPLHTSYTKLALTLGWERHTVMEYAKRLAAQGEIVLLATQGRHGGVSIWRRPQDADIDAVLGALARLGERASIAQISTAAALDHAVARPVLLWMAGQGLIEGGAEASLTPEGYAHWQARQPITSTTEVARDPG